MDELTRGEISTLSGRLGDKWRRDVLARLAGALRAPRMGALMFSEMFSVLEQMAALLATILIRWHFHFSDTNPPDRSNTIHQHCPAL
jgi:hypothetical protein